MNFDAFHARYAEVEEQREKRERGLVFLPLNEIEGERPTLRNKGRMRKKKRGKKELLKSRRKIDQINCKGDIFDCQNRRGVKLCVCV